ncbi:MAG: hypothetical protein WC890_07525 [Candidatus Margulisiibacteriota bacterium]
MTAINGLSIVLGLLWNKKEEPVENQPASPFLSTISSPLAVLPPPAVDQILSAEASAQFLDNTLGKTVPADLRTTLIYATNKIIVGKSETKGLSAYVLEQVEKDPLLKDYLRWTYASVIARSQAGGLTPTGLSQSDKPADGLQDFASFAAGDEALLLKGIDKPNFIIEALRSGAVSLEAPFSTNKHGQITSYSLILRYGQYSQVVAQGRKDAVNFSSFAKFGKSTETVAKALTREGYLDAFGSLTKKFTGNPKDFAFSLDPATIDKIALESNISKEGVPKKIYQYLLVLLLLTSSGYIDRNGTLTEKFNGNYETFSLGVQLEESQKRALFDRLSQARNGYLIQESSSPFARGVVEYMQNLLVGAGSLSLGGGWEKGVYCLQTHNALYSFLSSENIMYLPNIVVEKQILTAQVDAAKKAHALYLDYSSSAFLTRYERYNKAQSAIQAISTVLDTAKRYESLTDNGKLTDAERAFLKQCLDARRELEPILITILADVVDLTEGKNPLILLDIEAIKTKRKIISSSGSTKLQKIEAFSSLVDRAAGLKETLYAWLKLCPNSTILDASIRKTINSLDTLIDSMIKDYPETYPYAQSEINAFSSITDSLAKPKDPTTKDEWISRYARANTISETILKETPARMVIISFLTDTMKSKKITDQEKVFADFQRLLDTASTEELIALSRHQYTQQIFSDIKNVDQLDILDDNIDDARDAMEVVTGEDNKKRSRQLYNLLATLYSAIEEHNRYADTPLGRENKVKKVSFEETIRNAREVLDALKPAKGETPEQAKIRLRAILNILSQTSGTYDSSALELAAGLEGKMREIALRDTKEAGSSQSLSLTPRGIRRLEEKYAQLSMVRGSVSYADLKRWSPELFAKLPKGISESARFLVSVFGDVVPVENATENTVAPLPDQDLEGLRISRTPTNFLRIEKLATLKLAISRYVDISDKQVLALSGQVTSRLTSIDLLGINKVFGEGKYYTFRPGSLDLNPLESAILLKVADAIKTTDPAGYKLLQRMVNGASSGARFEPAEREALTKLIDSLNPASFSVLTTVPGLDGSLIDEKSELMRALAKSKQAVYLMYHKNGLSTDKQATLNELAGYLEIKTVGRSDFSGFGSQADAIYSALIADGYINSNGKISPKAYGMKEDFNFSLSLGNADKHKIIDILQNAHIDWNISINDARLVEDEAPAELVSAIEVSHRENGLTFNAEEFKATYREAVVILRQLHGDLRILSSKYPPEEPGYEGIGQFGTEFYRKMVKSMGETIVAPSLSDSQIVGLPNDQIYEINALLFQEELTQLASIQADLDKINASDDSQAFRAAVDNCVGLADIVKGQAGLETWGIQKFTEAEKIDGNDDDNNLTSLAREVLRLTGQFSEAAKSPANFVYQFDQLFAATARLQKKIGELKVLFKDNNKKLTLLGEFETKVNSLHAGLSNLNEARKTLSPLLQKKTELEIVRARIIDNLSSDRFDKDKFERLCSVEGIPDLLTQNIVMDWAAGTFAGDQGIQLDPDGATTRMTAKEIFKQYFEAHPDGVLAFSNLMPEPGEDRATINAKMALSKIFEGLPREQVLDLLKVLPVFTSAGSLVTFGPGVVSQATGGLGEIEIGPSNAAELRDYTKTYNRPQYAALSFLALSSSMYAKTNMSSQLFTILSSSPKGQEYLSQALIDQETGEFKLNTVTQRDVNAFVDYVEKELFPQIDRNPRLHRQIEYLANTKRISIDYTDPAARQALLTAIREKPIEGKQKIYDSFHADDDMRPLAKVIEDIGRISGEINKTRAAEDVDVYAMTYFDPITTLCDASMIYQQQGQEKFELPRKIGVIRYEDVAKPGELSTDWGWSSFKADAIEWQSIYMSDFWSGLGHEISEHPEESLEEGVRSSAAFIVHFGKLMSPQIRLGFTDTIGGIGSMVNAAVTLDGSKFYNAAARTRDGLAQTTGSFLVYETISFMFLADLKNDLEARNYVGFFFKLSAILAMTGRQNIETFELGGELIGAGIDAVEGRNPGQRLGNIKHRLASKTGVKLFYWTTPIGWINESLKLYRHYNSNLQVAEVSAPKLEIRLVSEGTERTGLLEKAGSVIKEHRKPFRETRARISNKIDSLGRRAVEATVDSLLSNTTAASSVTDTAWQSELARAHSNPTNQFEISLKRNGSQGSIVVDGPTFERLSRSTSARETGRIITEYNLQTNNPKYRLSIGNMRDLHTGLEGLRTAAATPSSAPSTTTPARTGEVVDAYTFLKQATGNRGLNNTYDIYTDGQTTPTQLTGRQIRDILTGNSGSLAEVQPETAQKIQKYFSDRIEPKEYQKLVHKAGKSAQRQVTGKFVSGKLDRGLVRRGFDRITPERIMTRFGGARFVSWFNLRRAIAPDLVRSYAEAYYQRSSFPSRINLVRSRWALAKHIYSEYITLRTQAVIEGLNTHVRAALSPEEFARFERNGNVLDRGIVRLIGNQFRKVYRAARVDISARLANVDAAFDVNARANNIIEQMTRQTHNPSSRPSNPSTTTPPTTPAPTTTTTPSTPTWPMTESQTFTHSAINNGDPIIVRSAPDGTFQAFDVASNAPVGRFRYQAGPRGGLKFKAFNGTTNCIIDPVTLIVKTYRAIKGTKTIDIAVADLKPYTPKSTEATPHTRSVFGNIAGAGIIGSIFGAASSVSQQYNSTGSVDLATTFADAVQGGIGWGTFATIQSGAVKLLGMASETKSMAFAMGITTLWQMHQNPEQSSQIAASSISGAAGFMAGMRVAKKLESFPILNKPWLRTPLELGLGIGGAAGGAKAYEMAYQNNFLGTRTIVDSEFAHKVGFELSELSDPADIYYGAKAATNFVLPRVAAWLPQLGLTSAKIAVRANIAGMLAAITTMESDRRQNVNPIADVSIESLSSGKSPAIMVDDIRLIHDINYGPARADSRNPQVTFDLLVQLYRTGALKPESMQGLSQEEIKDLQYILEDTDNFYNDQHFMNGAYEAYQTFVTSLSYDEEKNHAAVIEAMNNGTFEYSRHILIQKALASGIATFQTQHKIQPNGQIDASTVSALLSAPDKEKSASLSTNILTISNTMANCGVEAIKLNGISSADFMPYIGSLEIFVLAISREDKSIKKITVSKVSEGVFKIIVNEQAYDRIPLSTYSYTSIGGLRGF